MSYILCIVNVEFMRKITIVHNTCEWNKGSKEQSKKQQPQDKQANIILRGWEIFWLSDGIQNEVKWGKVFNSFSHQIEQIN